LQEKQN